MEAARFLLFSSLESIAAFFLMLKLFRLRPTEYLWPAVAVFLLMAGQSYFLRAELNLSYIAPAANLISYMLLIALVVRVPIVWAAIISAIGFFAYAAIQALVVASLFGSFDDSMQYSSSGSLLQIVSSAFTFALTYVLHKLRIGFTAEFERLRFRGEGLLIVVLIGAALGSSAVVMYNNNTLHILAFMATAAAIFLYYAIFKERREGQS